MGHLKHSTRALNPYQRALHAVSESQVCHGMAAHAARSADERVDIIAAVDLRSDAHFLVAYRLIDDIDRETTDPVARQLAKRAKYRLSEGLRLDAIEGEHLQGGIRPDLAVVQDVSRDGASVCGAALGQRGNGGGSAA